MKTFQIAIDGPVAAGKSTVARILAKTLNFTYVDTGAMYRAITLLSLRRGVRVDDENEVVRLLKKTKIDVRSPNEKENDGRLSTVLLNGEDVSWEIREAKVGAVVAKIASLPKVREVLVEKQREIAGNRNVVMEGRDITYVVLPKADLKIFLTASEAVRVERYFLKMRESEPSLTMEKAKELLLRRDELDKNRKTSPLKKVKDAWVLDTSELTIEEVVETIATRVKELENERRKRS